MRRGVWGGSVVAVKHGTEPGAMFTVRKVSSGVGVEKIFPIYSPMIETIEGLRRTRTRRAKLYFIRRKAASEVKRAMRRQLTVDQRTLKVAEPSEEATNVEPDVSESASQKEEVAAAE